MGCGSVRGPSPNASVLCWRVSSRNNYRYYKLCLRPGNLPVTENTILQRGEGSGRDQFTPEPRALGSRPGSVGRSRVQ